MHLEIRQSSSKNICRIWAVMVSMFFSNLILTVFEMADYSFGPTDLVDYTFTLGYCLLSIYLILWIEQFSFAVLALRKRFDLLNRNLLLMFNNNGETSRMVVINLYGTKSSRNLAKTISDLYSDLCDGIDIVNEALTFQLIPFIFYYLSTNLFTIYGMIRVIADGSSVSGALMSFGWITYGTIILVFTIYSSEVASSDARQTPIIISSILKSEQFKTTEDVFKKFLLEVNCREIAFKNQFFVIEWKLFLSVRQKLIFIVELFLKYLFVDNLSHFNIYNCCIEFRHRLILLIAWK